MASQSETPSTQNVIGYNFKHRSNDPWILERSRGLRREYYHQLPNVRYRCDAHRKGDGGLVVTLKTSKKEEEIE